MAFPNPVAAGSFAIGHLAEPWNPEQRTENNFIIVSVFHIGLAESYHSLRPAINNNLAAGFIV